MAWTEPKTWAAADPLTAQILNQHLKDNLNALKNPPSKQSVLDEASNYVTTSGSWVDIDATEGKLQHTITTHGGDVLVHFHGSITTSGGAIAQFNFAVDGVLHAANDGIVAGSGGQIVAFTRLVTGLAPGTYVFKLKWKRHCCTTESVTLYAGAGTTYWDLHPQFWVREVS